MKIYLAASSRELERVDRVMADLIASGHSLTHNWVPGVRAAFAAGIEEAKADDAHAFEAALADMNGVVTADVLVFLAPTDTSKMAWAELGGALARGIPVIVAHDDPECRNQSIVTRLATARVADADICGAIVGAFYMGRRL